MDILLPSPTTSFTDLELFLPSHQNLPLAAAIPPTTPPTNNPPQPSSSLSRAPSRLFPPHLPRSNSSILFQGPLSRSGSRFSFGRNNGGEMFGGGGSGGGGVLQCAMSGNGLYLMGEDEGKDEMISGGGGGGGGFMKAFGRFGDDWKKGEGLLLGGGGKEEGFGRGIGKDGDLMLGKGGGGLKKESGLGKIENVGLGSVEDVGGRREEDVGMGNVGNIGMGNVGMKNESVKKSANIQSQTNVDLMMSNSDMDENENENVMLPRRKKIRRRRLTKEEESKYDPRLLKDLTGTTAAKSRKMSVKERDIMLHKRRLRNRASAARSREKQRKTIGELMNDYEKLHGCTIEILNLCKRIIEHDCGGNGKSCETMKRNQKDFQALYSQCTQELPMIREGQKQQQGSLSDGVMHYGEEHHDDSDSASALSLAR